MVNCWARSKAALESIDGHAAMARAERRQVRITLSEADESIVLTEEDLLISDSSDRRICY